MWAWEQREALKQMRATTLPWYRKDPLDRPHSVQHNSEHVVVWRHMQDLKTQLGMLDIYWILS